MNGSLTQRFLDTWVGPAFERPPDPTVAPVGASKAERQARQALRWYSPSWRDAHGEELVSTVLDTLPANDREFSDNAASDSGLSWHARWDLAIGGLVQRRRSRPSLLARGRLLKGTEPLTPEGLAWLRDTLDQRGYCRLDAIRNAFIWLPQTMMFDVIGVGDGPQWGWFLVAVFLGIMLSTLGLMVYGTTLRRR